MAACKSLCSKAVTATPFRLRIRRLGVRLPPGAMMDSFASSRARRQGWLREAGFLKGRSAASLSPLAGGACSTCPACWRGERFHRQQVQQDDGEHLGGADAADAAGLGRRNGIIRGRGGASLVNAKAIVRPGSLMLSIRMALVAASDAAEASAEKCRNLRRASSCRPMGCRTACSCAIILLVA